MANLCSFSMCVKGKHEDIEQFYNTMIQEGNIIMGRGAEAEIIYEDNCYGDGYDYANIDGWCKWSVSSAMVSNAIDMRMHPDKWYWGENVDVSQLEFITLWEACKKWNLVMEVYSEEPGCGFSEHYVCDKGDLVCDECVDFNEYCLDEYDSKAEAERELGITITGEEWESGGWISCGGFDEWEFEI